MENSKDIRLLVLNILKEGRINIEEAEKLLNYITQTEKENPPKASFQYPNSETITEFAKEGVSKLEKFVSGFGINLEKVAQNIGQRINSNKTQGEQTGEKFTFNEEENIPITETLNKIIIENNWGGIKVTGEETQSITLKVEKIIWTNNQDLANKKNNELKIGRIQSDGTLQIILPETTNEMNDTINIEVLVPKNLSFDLFTSNGDIFVQNIDNTEANLYIKNSSGDTEIEKVNIKNTDILSVSGDLFFREIKTQLNARTTSGKIELDGIINNDSRLTTISGDIKGQFCSNDKLEISSSSGSIDVKQHKSQLCKLVDIISHSGDIHYNGVIHNTFRARTSSGDLKGHAIVANDANIEITSNSGDISWSIDEDSNLSFRCESKSGDIFTNLLPEEVTKSQSDVSGKIKEGIAKLSISTISGDLKFHRENTEVKV